METFEDYLEEKFIEENPEHYVKGFQYEGYYENWVMSLSRSKLIELADKAVKEQRREEQERILGDLDSKIDDGLFKNYSKQETIDEIICIIKNK